METVLACVVVGAIVGLIAFVMGSRRSREKGFRAGVSSRSQDVATLQAVLDRLTTERDRVETDFICQYNALCDRYGEMRGTAEVMEVHLKLYELSQEADFGSVIVFAVGRKDCPIKPEEAQALRELIPGALYERDDDVPALADAYAMVRDRCGRILTVQFRADGDRVALPCIVDIIALPSAAATIGRETGMFNVMNAAMGALDEWLGLRDPAPCGGYRISDYPSSSRLGHVDRFSFVVRDEGISLVVESNKTKM